MILRSVVAVNGLHGLVSLFQEVPPDAAVGLLYGTIGVAFLLLIRVSGVMLLSAGMIGLCYSIPTVGAVMICRELYSPDRYSRVFPKINLGVSLANAAGYPVLVWWTVDYKEPRMTTDFIEYGDETFWWYGNEHCVMLQGFDLIKGEVILQDPEKGQVRFDLGKFKEIYEAVGRFAVGIY